MSNFFFILLTLINFSLYSLEGDTFRDLNLLRQDFVLGTKKINIPGYPEAFNPSIVHWQGKLLLSFRTYDPLTRSTDLMGLVWLDENFDPCSTPTLLRREGEIAAFPSEAKDPRLIVVDQDLFIIYSNAFPYDLPISRMYVGKIDSLPRGEFKISFPSPLIHYDKEIRGRKEKNWIPFVHENTLLLAYSIQPHRIFYPRLEKHSCTSLGSTIGSLKWDWGFLRGGTPALMVEGQYLAFFHSDKAMTTIQSGGKIMNHYFMGAYTFQAEYPFGLTGISPHPIVDNTFYEGPMYKTWKPLRVVYPGGYVVQGNTITLAYGRQDHEVWIVKFDKTKLLKSLSHVETANPGVCH